MTDNSLLAKIWKVRDQVLSLGLKRVVSTRFVKDPATAQQALGWNHDKIMTKLVQSWSAADRQKVGL